MWGGVAERASGQADGLTEWSACTPISEIVTGMCKGFSLALGLRFPRGWVSWIMQTKLTCQYVKERLFNRVYRGSGVLWLSHRGL